MNNAVENSGIPQPFTEVYFREGGIVDMANKFHAEFYEEGKWLMCMDTEARAPNGVSGKLYILYAQACSASKYRAKSLVLAKVNSKVSFNSNS